MNETEMRNVPYTNSGTSDSIHKNGVAIIIKATINNNVKCFIPLSDRVILKLSQIEQMMMKYVLFWVLLSQGFFVNHNMYIWTRLMHYRRGLRSRISLNNQIVSTLMLRYTSFSLATYFNNATNFTKTILLHKERDKRNSS